MNKTCSQLILAALWLLLMAGLAHGQKAPAGYSQADYERGRTDAQNDVSRGVLVYEFAALPAASDDEDIRLLRDRYHIELRRVAGEEIRIDAISHMVGYNEISLPEIERRLGKGILEKVDQEAKANYAKKMVKSSGAQPWSTALPEAAMCVNTRGGAMSISGDCP